MEPMGSPDINVLMIRTTFAVVCWVLRGFGQGSSGCSMELVQLLLEGCCIAVCINKLGNRTRGFCWDRSRIVFKALQACSFRGLGS